MKSTQFKI